MTATTEPITTPEVPAWLNLDGLGITAAQVARVRQMPAQIERFITDSGLEEMMRDAYEARYAVEGPGVPDKMCDVLDDVFNLVELHNVIGRIADWALCALGCEPTYVVRPDWFKGTTLRTEEVQP